MKSTVAPLVKTAVTVVLFYFLFRKVDLHQFWHTLRGARFGYLVAGFAVLWLAHYLCIFRWRILMKPLMPVLSFGHLFGVYCIGLFFNLAFPTVIGGDVVKVYYAGKPSRKYACSFAATFLDRDAGMLAMMMIACAATLVQRVEIPGVAIESIVWGAAVAFVVANVALFAPSLHDRITQLMIRLRAPRAATRIDTLSRAFQVMRGERSVLLSALVISFANQFLVILVNWIMALGLRLDVSLHYFLVFIPVITLISMIPISLNGMGLREYAYVSMFTAVGVSPEGAIALGLLSSAVLVLSAVPGGLLYVLFKQHVDVSEMAALEADAS
jgi:uncharacterized protein (TIRG00374 family)